jgi:hypothetical protein
MTFDALFNFLGARDNSSLGGGFQDCGVVGSAAFGVGWTEPSRMIGKVITVMFGFLEEAVFRCDLFVGDCLDGDRLLGERFVGD